MNRTSVLAVIVALALCGAGVAWNLGSFDRHRLVVERYQPTFVVLPKPEVVRVLSLGFDSLAADWYWIKGVNYFGDQRNVAVAYGEFYNFLKLVVDLDPKYFPAYLFGGYALPWNRGDKWVNTEQAAELLERGTREFPNDWRLKFQLAFIYSSYLHRYKDAGDQLAQAAVIPGAPPYLGSLATRMYAQTGDYVGGELLAEELLAQTRNPGVRQLLSQRIAELRASNEAAALTHEVALFKQRTGHNPASLAELGKPIPAEPLGGAWHYDAATGQVTSSALNDRLKLYVHPDEHDKINLERPDGK